MLSLYFCLCVEFKQFKKLHWWNICFTPLGRAFEALREVSYSLLVIVCNRFHLKTEKSPVAVWDGNPHSLPLLWQFLPLVIPFSLLSFNVGSREYIVQHYKVEIIIFLFELVFLCIKIIFSGLNYTSKVWWERIKIEKDFTT